MKKVHWMLIPVAAFVMVCIIFKSVFFVGVVPSSSMEPTISKGSWILDWGT